MASFSGNWNDGFNNQGSWGNLWSRSANLDWDDNAMNTNFNGDNVNPGNNNWNRNNGLSVR